MAKRYLEMENFVSGDSQYYDFERASGGKNGYLADYKVEILIDKRVHYLL